MTEKFELLIRFIVTLIKLSKPGGVKVVMAETQAMKQQLIVMNRGKSRAPKLSTFDRFFFGFLAFFVGEKRLQRIAIIIKPATILKFHKALVQRKYRGLYSNKNRKNPGRIPPGDGPSWLTFIGHMKDSLWSRSAVPCRPVPL